MAFLKPRLTTLTLAIAAASASVLPASAAEVPMMAAGAPTLLTDPFLQNPSSDSVRVVWMTNFDGMEHTVYVAKDRIPPGQGKGNKVANPFSPASADAFSANTVQLQRVFEDSGSKLDNAPDQVMQRQVFRHEALVNGLSAGEQRDYWIVSRTREGETFESGPFRLQPLPEAGEPLQILLTSDQQERFNTLANYQNVADMFPDLDAVFFAGDLANHPRRASEWFDNDRSVWDGNPTAASPAFFPSLQGRFDQYVPQTPYKGGTILQNTPLFPAVANHEVSGRFRPNETVVVNGSSRTVNINYMFGDAQPRWHAEYRYDQVQAQVNPGKDPEVREQWVRDNSNDFETYREIFSLPDNGPEGESYYSKKVGDVLLISMNVSRIWRTWNIGTKGKFSEHDYDLNNPEEWGFGEHIFTPFAEGSPQFEWLQQVVHSEEFKSSKYRVVMFHQSATGLGDNAVPVLTDPLLTIDFTGDSGETEALTVLMPQDPKLRKQVWAEQVAPLMGKITSVRYEYPIDQDYFRRDIEPMLQAAGAQLVLHGHSHVWNRVKAGDLHYLETSSVGNCFGAYWTQPDGTPWNGALRAAGYSSFWNAVGEGRYEAGNYPQTGDAQGREPIMPTLANPMVEFGASNDDLPFVCSNDISTFSILDTAMGAVRSFAFKVSDPDGEVIEFDRFSLD